jgi:hypothetical protein
MDGPTTYGGPNAAKRHGVALGVDLRAYCFYTDFLGSR